MNANGWATGPQDFEVGDEVFYSIRGVGKQLAIITAVRGNLISIVLPSGTTKMVNSGSLSRQGKGGATWPPR